MHIYHFVLAALSFSCGASAAAGKTMDLREVAANDLSASEAAPNHQQAADKSQCALDVASLNRGDVQIELPGGKIGFETFPNCTTIFSPKFLDEIGVDHSTCIMSVPQLTKASFTISRFREFMPKEALDYLEYLKGPLTTGRAGTITCEVSTGQFSKTHALKAWRPYTMTEGWQYLTFTDCNDDGWVGFGQGGSVDVDIKYKGKIGYASPSQSSQGGNNFISMVSTSYHVGNVGEEATNACCSPEPGVARDCSAVHTMIESFDLSSVNKDSL
uniref:Uncharacterized protein n=1 Tax=Skeletonema marinoi TaxID=267567 RepID=A0A6U3SVE5_9STRA|mmetsp:Transcript_10675/g.18183  ORF Transcript_10675/g.18183 Transcript_10675/m.18183 type:complete len:272 (+) Transcript_10675:58-873(+)